MAGEVETHSGTLAPTRAAQELELRRDEFQLAVQLGLVRTVPGATPGTPRAPGAPPASLGARGPRRRVEQAEIDRLRGAPDFPAGLRERVRTVGTTEAAELLAVPAERFTKLARTGHLSPVRFYLNRYRAVVWLYLAAELGEFALTYPGLLTGRLPSELRERVDGGEDRRPRNWRARRLGLLLRATEDPWVRAAAIASLLDPAQLSEVVADPYERTHLHRLRPEPPSGLPESAASREIAERLMVADDPDEILWHRMSLALALEEARTDRPAPRPEGVAGARPGPAGPGVAGLGPAIAGRGAAVAWPGTAVAGPGTAVARAPVAVGGTGTGVARPARAAPLARPPVRRTRRGLLDRLRRRKAAAGGETEATTGG
ncbi:DUF6397 family protein [Streptomyces sp. P9(2023)]|uniref:DUF6397 family protein n=1 Tax=Streptomyces sp. P9(2023) TaxID=3064394 RepID=UPI0028F42E52|nr:DUF6397 family protein [Streptomyces sp. P9(2023)]MDT9686914.1 DUF6397 family protein [Streptomyces sp. P9(2023)]